MKFSCKIRGEAMVIALDEPRFVAAECSAFKQTLKTLVDQGADWIILDLRAVEFMDSSGLGSLTSHLKYTGEERRFYLSSLTPSVAKMFALTHMDTVFAIYDDISAALGAPDVPSV